MHIPRFLIFFFIVTTQSLFATNEVLFSPDDHPTVRLTQLFNRAKKRIHGAIYMITDKNIATALVDAKKRGVDVQIIVDPTSMESSYGKGSVLKKNNIDLYVFAPPHKHGKKKTFHGPIMHNKFALIDDQLWTGSFNWTKSANMQNQENVIITDDKTICDKFEQHFQIVKNRCTHCGTGITEEVSWWQQVWDLLKNTLYAMLS